MSSAPSFYETASGNLVSRKALADKDFGDSCFVYCGTEFERLKKLHGAVLVRNCSFNRMLGTADVKGMVEGYSNGTLTGWACKYGNEGAVELNVFAGPPPGQGQLNKDPMNGAAIRVFANLPPIDAADKARLIKECGTSATNPANAAAHRFAFSVPQALSERYAGQTVFVHDVQKNYALGNSGAVSLSKPTPVGPQPFTHAEAQRFCVGCHSSGSAIPWGRANGSPADWAVDKDMLLKSMQSNRMPPPVGLPPAERDRFIRYLQSL